MKKLILLCLVFVFSNATFAQDVKEKASKTKSKTEKAVKAKKEKADKLKEEKAKAKKDAEKEAKKAEKDAKTKTFALANGLWAPYAKLEQMDGAS